MAKKELETDLMEGDVENTKEPRLYELAFHIDGEKSESEAIKIYEALKKVAGKTVAEGTPHHIQLAYTISRMEPSGRHDFNTSYFAWFVYEADSAQHENVIEGVKEQKSVFRFLDTLTTLEEATESQQLHELRMEEAKQRGNEDEGEENMVAEAEVVDAELDAALKEAV